MLTHPTCSTSGVWVAAEEMYRIRVSVLVFFKISIVCLSVSIFTLRMFSKVFSVENLYRTVLDCAIK